MNTLYWITTLGNLSELFSALSIFLCMFLVLCIFCIICEPSSNIIKKITKWVLGLLIPITLINIFIPNKQDLYIIYGVGTTLDYLKENPQTKQLPDRCIKAIDNYLNKLNEDDINKDHDSI